MIICYGSYRKLILLELMWVIQNGQKFFFFVAHRIMARLIIDGLLDLLKYIIISILKMGSHLRGQVTCPGDSDCRLEL